MWHEGSGNGWGTCVAGTMRREIEAINNGIYHVMITCHVTQSLSGIVHVTTVMPEQNTLSGNIHVAMKQISINISMLI